MFMFIYIDLILSQIIALLRSFVSDGKPYSGLLLSLYGSLFSSSFVLHFLLVESLRDDRIYFPDFFMNDRN